MPSAPGQHTSIRQHLIELRRRVVLCVIAWIAGSTIGFIFRGPLIAYLQQPLGHDLFYTSPQGSFEFVMQASMLVGLLLAMPVVTYQLVRFVEPAFARTFGRRTVILTVGASSILAVAGAAFAYYVSLPAALHFFNDIGTSHLRALISVDRYFSFLVTYLGVFAITFQLPLVLLFANHVTPIPPSSLGKWRKFVVVIAFGIALVTPSAPDPLSQILLALPIIVLYELSIIIIRLQSRGHVQAPVAIIPQVPAEQPRRSATRRPAAMTSARPIRAAPPALRPVVKPASRIVRDIGPRMSQVTST